MRSIKLMSEVVEGVSVDRLATRNSSAVRRFRLADPGKVLETQENAGFTAETRVHSFHAFEEP